MSFIENNKNGFVYMTASNIETVHAFTTRFGGGSQGIYSSLNLSVSSGDTRENIESNYKIMCSALGLPLEDMVYTKQVHKAYVQPVTKQDSTWLFDTVPVDRDVLITNVPGLPIIAFTADCIPVLLYDKVAGAVGAIHAGWRSTVQNIVGNAVFEMSKNYGSKLENIMCAIGPGIGKCCFETDSDVPEAVISVLGKKGEQYVRPQGDKFYVDIKGVNSELLQRAGVPQENIEVSDECTICCHDKYWSHRYTKGRRGCQACVIMLKGK